MARSPKTNGQNGRASSNAKYDAHQTVLSKAYGAFADLRRELADSKTALAERAELLKSFAECADSQRAWLLLEDYFEKLSLARKDFPGQTWWPRMLAARGKTRLEEAALLFLKNGRNLPTELAPYANLKRFAEIEQAEQENAFLDQLEHWLLPPPPSHLDSPRATIRAIARVEPAAGKPLLHQLAIQCHLFRPRTGEKVKTPAELVELTTRSAHERELFHAHDWEFIEWVGEQCGAKEGDTITLTGPDLLLWLARWGNSGRIHLHNGGRLKFVGEVGEMLPDLHSEKSDLALAWKFVRADGKSLSLAEAKFFAGQPLFALVDDTFVLVRNAPASELMHTLLEQGAIPVKKLNARVLTHLRSRSRDGDSRWKELCRAHKAIPQFTFELSEETVRLRLLARSELDGSIWQWNGHDWQPTLERETTQPEILDDARLQPATLWLRRLDWFTPEPGIWVGDASEAFLNALASTWQERPAEAEYYGDAAFQRLFLTPKRLKPKLMVQGSGIDWFSVSAAWEQEGMRLSPADLERLASATGRYVKLPDSGWVELDTVAVHAAHEAFAELGLEGLAPIAQKVDLMHARHMDEQALARFEQQAAGKSIRERLADFKGIPPIGLPKGLQAEMRPYQKEGFDFLCHLTHSGLGGVLADDMGLGKTLQTLSWLGWLREQAGAKKKPALVICPA
ncbi:MAG TPA: DEAD/DEAH box helicase, partial [Methylomirabilota bacterium]|nr:DEAD/DEAH box helicase [Methylomirabilota bacterium]